jgi:hypothetical protein
LGSFWQNQFSPRSHEKREAVSGRLVLFASSWLRGSTEFGFGFVLHTRPIGCTRLHGVARRCTRLHESHLRRLVEIIAADRVFSGVTLSPHARGDLGDLDDLPKSRASLH